MLNERCYRGHSADAIEVCALCRLYHDSWTQCPGNGVACGVLRRLAVCRVHSEALQNQRQIFVGGGLIHACDKSLDTGDLTETPVCVQRAILPVVHRQARDEVVQLNHRCICRIRLNLLEVVLLHVAIVPLSDLPMGRLVEHACFGATLRHLVLGGGLIERNSGLEIGLTLCDSFRAIVLLSHIAHDLHDMAAEDTLLVAGIGDREVVPRIQLVQRNPTELRLCLVGCDKPAGVAPDEAEPLLIGELAAQLLSLGEVAQTEDQFVLYALLAHRGADDIAVLLRQEAVHRFHHLLG